MPYVLKENATGRLLSAMQVNGYQLPYYGILIWENAPTESEKSEALKKAEVGSEAAAGWTVAEVSGHQAKMANVKLRNDVRRIVFLKDNALIAEDPQTP